jgi:hypothetical protein
MLLQDAVDEHVVDAKRLRQRAGAPPFALTCTAPRHSKNLSRNTVAGDTSSTRPLGFILDAFYSLIGETSPPAADGFFIGAKLGRYLLV